MTQNITIESPLSVEEILTRVNRLGLQIGVDIKVGLDPTHFNISLEAIDQILNEHIDRAQSVASKPQNTETRRDWLYLHLSPETQDRLTSLSEQFTDGLISHADYHSQRRQLRRETVDQFNWDMDMIGSPKPYQQFILAYGHSIPGTTPAIADGSHRACDVLIHATQPLSSHDLITREQGIQADRVVHVMVVDIDNADVNRWLDEPAQLPMTPADWRRLTTLRHQAI